MKEPIRRYVALVKKLFIVFSVVMIFFIMNALVFAFSGYLVFKILAPAAIVLYFTVYGLYALRVQMGTAIGIEVTNEVVHVKTKRKTFTYDVRCGCKSVKVKKNRFICIFETQDSRDSFIFYRKVPFAKAYEEGFTEEDIARFYSAALRTEED